MGNIEPLKVEQIKVSECLILKKCNNLHNLCANLHNLCANLHNLSAFRDCTTVESDLKKLTVLKRETRYKKYLLFID